jgi:acetylornithine/succinyldiaminopimelate/putrescine aminotransferase
MVDYLSRDQPAFIQPFMAESSKELSIRLCQAAGKDYDFCVFTNSGAETVEAAIKLARTKTQRTKILSAKNSFHGKSFAALSATGSSRYSNEYIVDTVHFRNDIPFNDVDALAEALTSKQYAAFIVEPVQGEGGMIPATQEYLMAARELCDSTGTMLIFDEVQTGLGRTGKIFAKDLYNVKPDMLLLSKALGGGTYRTYCCIDLSIDQSVVYSGSSIACPISCSDWGHDCDAHCL